MIDKCEIIGDALAELVEQARSSGSKIRVGLMAAGSELGTEELLRGAALALSPGCQAQSSGHWLQGAWL